MDIQNNNVSIQINAKDLSGRDLRISDCDVFIVHVFTNNPRFYLTFSKRDMLMTEFVDELVVPRHQMEQLESGVVQYTYHYLPKAHECIYEAPEFEEDNVEMQGAYHPHRHHGHGPEDLIHSKPVVTPIYWRNIKHPHPAKPLNSVTLVDIERLHRLIENERIAREKDVESLQGQFGEDYGNKLDEEIERSKAEDEKFAQALEKLGANLDEFTGNAGDINDKVQSDIIANTQGLKEEVERAVKAEAQLEAAISSETARAKAAEEVVATALQMEKERATANEANIGYRIDAVNEKFEAFKTIESNSLQTEVERAKAVENQINTKVDGVIKDLADEVSRAAQKDIQHTDLVNTEVNRAQAVENRISTDLETEINRAKDAEKHILDEVHGVQDVVSNLATATNVYTKAEIDTKVNEVKNDVSTVQNWINNHSDNTDELKAKVANLVEDVDKAKADLLAEVAKCDAANNKLATDIQTVVDSTYTKAEVDTKVNDVKNDVSAVQNWIENHKDNTEGLAEKVNKNVTDIQTLVTDLANETTARTNADLMLETKVSVVEGKVDAEVERAKASEALISDEIAEIKANAQSKHTDIEAAITDVNANLTIETARAKAAEKVNSDAIEIINGDASTAGSIKKSLADGKAYTDAEIAKLSLAKDVELADTLKVYATNADVDKKISEVVGTAPEALDTLGKISNALAQDSDAITAINGVLSGKAEADNVYTKAEIDTQVTGVNNSMSVLETKLDNADSAISGRIDDLVAKVNANESKNADDVSALNAALTDEVARAKNAEKATADKLDEEIGKVTDKVNDLTAKVIQDIADSTAKDTEIDANISALQTLLANVEKKVDDEVIRATTKDNELVAADASISAKVQANSEKIDSEIARAKQVETELNDKINSIDLAGANSNISSLSDKVDAEIVRAQNAEKVVTDNLADEIDRAKAAEKSLSDRIDALDLTGANNAISALDTKIDNAQTTLQTNLDAEVVRAKAAEKVNADNIDSLLSSVSGINDNVTTLSANLTQLQADSQAKDSEIETAIANEKVRAENAEKALSDKIDVLNADASTVGSLAHAIHDAEHYTDDEIAKVQSALDIHKAEADAKYLTEHQSLSDYYDKATVNSIFDGYATKASLNSVIEDYAQLHNDLASLTANVYTKKQVDEAIANVDVTEQLKDYVTNASLNEAVDKAVAESEQIVSLSDDLSAETARAKAAEKEINDSIETISEIVAQAVDDLNSLFDSSAGEGGTLSVVTKDELDSLLDDYYTKDAITQVLSDMATKTEVDEAIAAAKVEADAKYQAKGNYLTEHQSLDSYYTKAEVNALIPDISGKADASTVYTKTQIDNKFLRGVMVSQEEYDALVAAGEIEENVLYIIV